MTKLLIDYNTILSHTLLGYKTPIEHVMDADKSMQNYVKSCIIMHHRADRPADSATYSL